MKTKKILLNSLPLLFVGGIMAYAAAPTGGYLPNATLDPDCAPGDTDCFVQIADDLTSAWDNTDGSVADETGNINYTEGFVGIGTTTPDYKLEVEGSPSGQIFEVTRGGNASFDAIRVNSSVRIASYPSAGAEVGLYGFGGGGVLSPIIRSANNTTAASGTRNDVYIAELGGNVGIGTNSPVSKTHISSGAGGQGDMILTLQADTTNTVEDSNPGINFQQDGQTGAAYSAQIGLADGGVANSGITGDITGVLNNSLVLNTQVSGNNLFAAVQLATADEVRMSVIQNGNVGIGTTTPNQTLDIYSDTTNPVVQLRTNGAFRPTFVFADDASSRRWFIENYLTDGDLGFNAIGGIGAGVFHLEHSSGNIGIGTTSPTEKLHVVGNILASGTITPSDRKLKDNIVEIENALDKVNAIGGYTYTLKSTGEEKAGVIAQEIEAVLPEAVNSYDDYKAVEYDMLNALLIEAVQELSVQNAELSDRIATLEATQ